MGPRVSAVNRGILGGGAFFFCGAEMSKLSGPISRDIAILSLRYPISRDTFSRRLAFPQNGVTPRPCCFVSRRHTCEIPHFARYRAIIAPPHTGPPGPKGPGDPVWSGANRNARYRAITCDKYPRNQESQIDPRPRYFCTSVTGPLSRK